MRVTLQYFNGCRNGKETEGHIETLRSEGFDLTFGRQPIETPEAAEQHGFRGSAAVLIEGVDLFADGDALVGLSGRVYQTETGFGGSPSLDQLRAAIAAAR